MTSSASIVTAPRPDGVWPVNADAADGLTAVQQLLLRTDGTLTDLIAVLVGEPLRLVKIDHGARTATHPVGTLDLGAGEPLVERRIALQGARSRTVWLYAETSIAAARMPAALRRALETSDVPLGHLCRDHRLELFKESPTWRFGTAGPAAGHFGVSPAAVVATRRYRMIVGGRPIAELRECFAPVLWRRSVPAAICSPAA